MPLQATSAPQRPAGASSLRPPSRRDEFHDLLTDALPALRQQAMAMTRNRADADDLVQAAVANALAGRQSFELGTNFRAWTGRILRNRFLSDRRRDRPTIDWEDAPPEAFARGPAQEHSVGVLELRRAMARLPADQRVILLMVSVQGWSYDEASAALGVPVGTLKCKVFRARRQLELWLLGAGESAGGSDRARVGPPASARAGVGLPC